MSTLSRIHQLVTEGSQFIIATHSPILLAYPNADIYVLSQEGIRKTRYEDTEHYVVTRRFLEDPSGMLRILMSPQEDEATVPYPKKILE